MKCTVVENFECFSRVYFAQTIEGNAARSESIVVCDSEDSDFVPAVEDVMEKRKSTESKPVEPNKSGPENTNRVPKVAAASTTARPMKLKATAKTPKPATRLVSNKPLVNKHSIAMVHCKSRKQHKKH